jgi:hypothetical protein
MIENIGFAKSTAVSTAMIVGVSIVPTVLLQWKGGHWHGKEASEAKSADS